VNRTTLAPRRQPGEEANWLSSDAEFAFERRSRMNEVSTRESLSASLLLDPAVIDDPYAFYRRLVEEAPVWRVPGSEIVVVSSFEAVTEATHRVDDFSSNIRSLIYRNDAGTPELLPFDAERVDTLATADPPVHTAHRNAVFPELVARRMATLRPEIEDLADDHITSALTHSPLEVMSDIANAIPIRIVSKLIGFQNEDPARLLAAAFDSTAMFAAAEPHGEILNCMERTAEVFSWIGDQLQQTLEHGAEGILGAIGAAVAKEDLALGEGIVIMHTLLSAGGESTTSLLGNAIHMLAFQPELQACLRDKPELITSFIEEALRLESPFRYHLRHATRSTELGGVRIPAGSTMLLFWGAANRDPAEYDRPDEVVLDRPASRHHLAFGRGIHLCVGAPLARLEAQVVLMRLLEHTTQLALDPDHHPTLVSSLMVRRFASLPVLATRRTEAQP
jgi:cytochrome P450